MHMEDHSSTCGDIKFKEKGKTLEGLRCKKKQRQWTADENDLVGCE